MTKAEISRYIDRGADFYIDLFGRAEHMERVKRRYYSFVRPKGDVFGITFIYDVNLNGLPREKIQEQVAEIRALNMPVWLALNTSEEVLLAYSGKEKLDPPREPTMDDEAYMFMLPEGKPEYPGETQVMEVHTQEEFAQWAGLVNRVLSQGREDIHPQYHYPLCQDGLLRCYMVLDEDGKAVSAASAAVDRESVTLEFVATLPEYRRQGLAQRVCRRVVDDVFDSGAAIVTVRAIDGIAAALYESIGFRRYGLTAQEVMYEDQAYWRGLPFDR